MAITLSGVVFLPHLARPIGWPWPPFVPAGSTPRGSLSGRAHRSWRSSVPPRRRSAQRRCARTRRSRSSASGGGREPWPGHVPSTPRVKPPSRLTAILPPRARRFLLPDRSGRLGTKGRRRAVGSFVSRTEGLGMPLDSGRAQVATPRAAQDDQGIKHPGVVSYSSLSIWANDPDLQVAA